MATNSVPGIKLQWSIGTVRGKPSIKLELFIGEQKNYQRNTNDFFSDKRIRKAIRNLQEAQGLNISRPKWFGWMALDFDKPNKLGILFSNFPLSNFEEFIGQIGLSQEMEKLFFKKAKKQFRGMRKIVSEGPTKDRIMQMKKRHEVAKKYGRGIDPTKPHSVKKYLNLLKTKIAKDRYKVRKGKMKKPPRV